MRGTGAKPGAEDRCGPTREPEAGRKFQIRGERGPTISAAPRAQVWHPVRILRPDFSKRQQPRFTARFGVALYGGKPDWIREGKGLPDD